MSDSLLVQDPSIAPRRPHDRGDLIGREKGRQKGLLRSTGYDVSTQAPSPGKRGARAVSLLALGRAGLGSSEPVSEGWSRASTPPTGRLRGGPGAYVGLSPVSSQEFGSSWQTELSRNKCK